MIKKITALILSFGLFFTSHGLQSAYAVPNTNLPEPLYREIPVTIGPYYLRGKLLKPYGTENPPVAILIQGTGQTNKNSAFGAIAPFKDIAHGLAAEGIATIRFNKRFYQHPPIPADMTLHTEVLEDVSYAIHWAYNNEALGDIYLIGFSLGGIIAPTIAYQHSGMVAGIVSLAGSPRHFSEIIVSQSDMLSYIYAQALGIQLPAGLPLGHMINLVLSIDPEQLDEIPLIHRWAHWWGFPVSYLLSLREINTYAIINDLHIPMLILHGSEDLQLSLDYDFAAWQAILAGRDNASFILYEGLNHFFTPHVPELGYWQTARYAQVYYRLIYDIARWIND